MTGWQAISSVTADPQFIALVAPRPIFISGGEYIEGDGVPGTNSRYSLETGRIRPAPPLTPMIDGDIAFRQHDQGHVDAPNWPTFVEFAGHYFKSPGFKN